MAFLSASINRLAFALMGFAMLCLAGCSQQPSKVSRPEALDALQLNATNTHTHQRILLLQQHSNQWLGVPYRFGGNNKSGIDCSAFIRRTYDELWQYALPRTTAAQIQQGREIALTQASAGDLVFFQTAKKQRHTGIFIANGLFIHASTSKGVTISSLDNPYWKKTFSQARRIDAIHQRVPPKRPHDKGPLEKPQPVKQVADSETLNTSQ